MDGSWEQLVAVAGKVGKEEKPYCDVIKALSDIWGCWRCKPLYGGMGLIITASVWHSLLCGVVTEGLFQGGHIVGRVQGLGELGSLCMKLFMGFLLGFSGGSKNCRGPHSCCLGCCSHWRWCYWTEMGVDRGMGWGLGLQLLRGGTPSRAEKWALV